MTLEEACFMAGRGHKTWMFDGGNRNRQWPKLASLAEAPEIAQDAECGRAREAFAEPVPPSGAGAAVAVCKKEKAS